MESKKAPIFALTIVAIIVGVALFKQFDFQSFKFEKPALSVVYGITFVFCAYVIIKKFRNK